MIYSDRYDPIYNVTYPCLNCANNTEISDRCKVKTAPKVIYVIKANAKSNNDMYLALRAGFQNGYINMLANDINIEEHLSKIRGWLANALGLDVPQSQEYLEEVEKYTVTKPSMEEKEGSSVIYQKMYGSEE